MNIGYQGFKNCYSYQVSNKYLHGVNPTGYKSFELLFESLKNGELDYAVIPVENSIGGCIFINYDFFYKYNIKIHCEFHHEINHTLYSIGDLDEVKKVYSHPQALEQCKENIRKLNLEKEEFWDTVGALSYINELNDKSCAAIGPPSLGDKFNLNSLKVNFNDQSNNITRFYLISINGNNPTFINKKYQIINNKFSGYVIIKDQVGILSDYLNSFSTNGINLTKLESRPYLGLDRNTFSYIFYIEGEGVNKEEVKNFNYFGKFPLIGENKLVKKDNKLTVGVVGFGRFGKYIAERMSNWGFKVYATSRRDYSKDVLNTDITFLNQDDFINTSIDIVVFAPSILSFKAVIDSFPSEFYKGKLVVDVLSVKLYPQEVLRNLKGCDILLTHPMFGPDSGKYSWWGKKFVYTKEVIKEQERCNTFINFWREQGCEIIEMSCEEHDASVANSQFLTHFIGRTLELLDCKNTRIDTDGYESLLKIKEYTVNDSWDLFVALSKYNKKTTCTINLLKYQFHTLEEKLSDEKIIESETGKVFKKILKLKSSGKDIINCAIGVPSWNPPITSITFSNEYSTSKGNLTLIDNLIKIYNKRYSLNDNALSQDNIIITIGAKPALYLTFKILTKVGTKWLLPTPYWVSYPDMISTLNATTDILNTSVDNNFEPDLNIIEAKFKDDLMNGIILCNPNNPTGLLYNEEYLQKLLNLVIKYNKSIIIDEVYLFLTKGKTLWCNYEKMFIISSFSKYYGVPGWRVGWIISSPEYNKKLVRMQSNLYTCPPNASQEFCNYLIETNYQPELSQLDYSRDKLSELFLSKGWKLSPNNSSTMYLFPISPCLKIDLLVEKLLDNNLAVISGRAFGEKNAIRITLKNDKELTDRIYNILKVNI